jgi:lipopolysaccharide export system permease protein
MKIIRSYVVKELAPPFILSLTVLTCIFLLGNLIQLTNLVINKGVPITSVGYVFILYIPVLLKYTLSLACLISVIMAFSRLSIDNEIMALRASGIHIWSILKPLCVIGLIISLFSIIVHDRVIPYANYEQQLRLKNLGLENPAALLEPGVFINSFNGQIIFIHKIDDNRLTNITIYQPQENGPTRTILARRGEFTRIPGRDAIKLKLMDGTTDEPDPRNPNNFYKLNFNSFFMTLDLSGQRHDTVAKKPKSMSLKELRGKIDEMDELLVDSRRLRTEIWSKITWSFTPLVFILIGFPIAVITHKREKSVNILLAVLCAAAYYLISVGCESMAIKALAPAALIMWVPNLTGFLAALYLNIKCAS